MLITSTANPAVKAVAKLRKARNRQREGVLLIDGARALSIALQGTLLIETVYLCPERANDADRHCIQQAKAAGIVTHEVAEAPFARMAYGDAPDALIAVAARPGTKLSALNPGPCPLLVVVEGTEKPGNLGAILRTADAAGASGVIVCDPACDPFGPNVVRASRGTLFTLPLAVADAALTIEWLHSRNIAVISAFPDAATVYTDAPLAEPCAIVLGAEHSGLTTPWRHPDNHPVTLPMHGLADSLNLATTGAIMLYEALRQRAER